MIVTLRLVAPETGDDLAAFRETARDSTQLLSALDAVTKQMRRRIGESLGKVRGSPPMEAVTTSSLPALQKYSQAIRASERGEYEQAQSLLQEAIAIDSGFAMAWRKLGVSYSNQGNMEAAKEPLTRAFRFRDRLPDRERYMAIGSYYNAVGLDNDKAAAAWRAAALHRFYGCRRRQQPRPRSSGARRFQWRTWSSSVARSRRRDSSVVGFSNLIMSFLNAGMIDSAIALRAIAEARFPGNVRLRTYRRASSHTSRATMRRPKG